MQHTQLLFSVTMLKYPFENFQNPNIIAFTKV